MKDEDLGLVVGVLVGFIIFLIILISGGLFAVENIESIIGLYNSINSAVEDLVSYFGYINVIMYSFLGLSILCMLLVLSIKMLSNSVRYLALSVNTNKFLFYTAVNKIFKTDFRTDFLEIKKVQQLEEKRKKLLWRF